MFVVIEGIDGSGKGTVTEKLKSQLVEKGKSVDTVSFPGYGRTLYGDLVGKYLNGDFGKETHPLLHGTLFSIDRYESKDFLNAAIAYNEVVIADRYVPSNLCYSALKCKTEKEVNDVCSHFVKLEYDLFGLPVPDAIIFLDMPVKFAVQNIAKKAARSYTDLSADIYEADEDYLSQVRSFYCSKLRVFHPATRFKTVGCVRNGHMLPIASVVNEVENVLTQLQKDMSNGTPEA